MDENWDSEIGGGSSVTQPSNPPSSFGFGASKNESESTDLNNNQEGEKKGFGRSFGGFKNQSENGENSGGGFNRNRGDNAGGGNGFQRQRRDFGGERRDGDSGGGFRKPFNRDNNNEGGGRRFDRGSDSNGGGFRRNNDNNGESSCGGGFGGGFRRNNDNNGESSGGGGFGGGFRRNNDNNGESSGGGGFGGGFRRNNDNNGESSSDRPQRTGFGGGRGGFNRNNNEDGEGGERKGGFSGERRSFPPRDRDGNSGAGGERKFGSFNNRSGGDENGERKPFGNREGGGERRSFNRDNGEGGGERKSFGDRERKPGGGGGRGGAGEEGLEGMERKETYIPTYDESDEVLFHSMAVGVNFKKQAEIPVNVSGNGSDAIKPIETFAEAKLSDLMLTNVQKSKYEIPTPVQKYAIPIILAKRDLMACAQTGSGKTAAFVLPIMTNILHDGIESSGLMSVQTPQALILSPTRELAVQIFHECRKFSHGSIIKSAILYGGVDTRYQLSQLEKGCNILVATPGRLLDVLEKGKISLEKVKYFVLDEADRMLDMGFEKEVRKILEKGKVHEKTDRTTLMFSATFPSEIQKLAQDFLNDYLFLAVGIVGGANTDVEQKIHKVSRFEKRDKIVNIIDEIGNERIMIFMEHKKQADVLAFFLLQKKYPCTSIHGDRLQSQRETALAEFKSGKAKIIVCTSVAARGLDIEKVNYVINYDLPQSIDEYVHRIGRTGRCGNLGKAISFFDPDSENDRKLARSLVLTLRQAQQEIPDWLESAAEDSHGTTYGGDACTNDLRSKFEKFSMDSKPAAASAPSAGFGAAAQAEENWD